MKLFQRARVNSNCIECGFCKYFACKWGNQCTGCGACVISCPNSARELIETNEKRNTVKVTIDGIICEIPEQITILKALELRGYRINRHHGHDEEGIHAPCGTGGCGECNVLVDGMLMPGCVTPVKDGMDIITDQSVIKGYPPQRIVSVFNRNMHDIAKFYGIRETSYFMQGCNLNCPACHNWNLTYSSVDRPSTPDQLIQQLFNSKKAQEINRIGISGGEATLNRRWLLEFVRKISMFAPNNVRIQLDTNATLLTGNYIDELIEAGITDISPDIKGATVECFQQLTGIKDRMVATGYMNNMWESVRYILEKCEGKLFVVVGIPYHKALLPAEELHRIGEKLAHINPHVPVNLIEYQAAFRKRDLEFVTRNDTNISLQILQDAGLHNVLCQSAAEMPLAVDPLDLLSGEECNW